MKPFALSLLLGLTFSTFSHASLAQWGQLHRKDQIILKSDLYINRSLTFPAGTRFTVKEMVSFEEIQIEKFLITLNSCSPSIENASISLIILDQLYGFEMFSHCQTHFYVSYKDLFLDSYFEKASP